VRRLLVLSLLAAAVSGGAAPAADAHQSGCHSAHSCPSDHHTYVWYDGAGAGWDCVQARASEYDGSRDTTAITYDGRTYYCRAAGSAPPPQPADSDGDGIPDDQDACPSQPAPGPSGCPPPPNADGDANPDASDACPTQPGTDPNGCPPPPPPPPPPAAPCQVDGPYPDAICTPGAVFKKVTAKQVCRPGYSRRARRVSQSTKDRVFARYGITVHDGTTYEVDHFIPLELGGSNAMRNLFPEAVSQPGFRQKDRLENELHRRVCQHRMTLKAAQRAIRTDWVAALGRYVR
jgi:hypothetical protein